MIAILLICMVGAGVVAALMAFLGEEHQTILVRLVSIFGIGAVVALLCIAATTDSSGPSRSDYSPSYTSTDSSSYSGSTSHESYSTSSSAPATRFTMSSDGNTWNSASEAEKRRMAAGMAATSKNGNSANFYYDALETTYNTNDAYTKRQPMKDVHTLIEAGSSALPKSQRKY